MMPRPPQIVLVTGLSGAGKLSILRALEDLGFETVDNPPLSGLFDLAAKADKNLAIGVDARSRGFSADSVLDTLARLRQEQNFAPALVFATASDEVLLRRYSETRRRHPLAQTGAIVEGIALERALTGPLTIGLSRGNSVLQVLEHGEHAAMVLPGRPQPELVEDAGDVLLHDLRRDEQVTGDGGVGPALGEQREHLPLARGEFREGVPVPSGA